MKLGRYEIVRELGKGAMGVVYLAKDPLIGRLVALKTIRATRGDDEETREFQQRFIREAQAAGILNHPSIVTVHDIGQDEPTGTTFIAMEYVEGHNLKEILQQGRPLSFDEIGDIAAQVAEALDFAHSKGIVHRDVKPANIIVLEGNRAKITDFGIAKIASGGNLTTTGQFLGTPNYMAPEQIRGAAVDGRTDLFSLGICIYECLTRRKPFGGESLTSISYKIVHEAFPPLHDVNPQIPDGYADVVALCLAKDPGHRYQRGRDLAVALRQVIRGERPAKAEPLLEEATIITRTDIINHPTMEVPIPPNSPQGTLAAAGAGGAAAAAVALPQPAAKPVRAPRPDAGAIVRKTLNDVRAMPVWRTAIPPAIFFSLIGLAVLALVIVVAGIRSRGATVPVVDKALESKVRKERDLRLQGNQLLKDGNVAAAAPKFEQLGKLAPRSSYVLDVNTRLAELRRLSESKQQQLVQAKELFDQGMLLFNNKQYAEAVKAFDESFHLNPNSDDAANYLKLAQQEDARVKAEQARANPVLTKAPATTTTGSTNPKTTSTTRGNPPKPTPQPVATGPAQVITTFPGVVNDGYVQVRVGGEVVAHENLWQETGRFLLKRKVPRDVNVSKEVTPMSGDLEVWVIIPSLNIQEHHTIKVNLAPGSHHQLNVTFDPASKTFNYQFN